MKNINSWGLRAKPPGKFEKMTLILIRFLCVHTVHKTHARSYSNTGSKCFTEVGFSPNCLIGATVLNRANGQKRTELHS